MRFALVSGKGGREINEDTVGRLKKNGMYCFVLADGLGGQNGGETASSLASSTILKCFDSQAEMSKDIVYAYMEAAQNAIIEKRKENSDMRKMGTTVVTLIIDGKRAIWAHCGDSRLYRFRKHLIQEVTDDHSVAFASFLAGDIEYDEIRTSPDQNKLLRTLGDGTKFRPDISDVVKLEKNACFLMCSDGFWDYVDEDFMEYSRKRSSTPKEWLQYMLDERKRNAPRDADNYSAIAVFA